MENKTIYTHYKNGKDYYIIDYCSIQENDVWVTAILYKEVGGNIFFVRSEKEWDEKFKLKSAENNIDKLQKYRLMYEDCMNRIGGMLEEEMDNYSEFLFNENISVLPDGFYKNGEKLDYGDVRRLYDKSIKK